MIEFHTKFPAIEPDYVKAALTDANKAVAGGIQEAVMVKLNEVAAALKVSVITS